MPFATGLIGKVLSTRVRTVQASTVVINACPSIVKKFKFAETYILANFFNYTSNIELFFKYVTFQKYALSSARHTC